MMDKDVAISVKNVTMSFNLNKEKVDNLKEYAIKFFTRKLEYNKFNALNNINFEVKKGEHLAILGFNGAGKSTLLKTIVGVYKPTTGTVERCGVIAPLLELGAGFDPNYSGRENIYLYGAILGYSREYINSKYKEIVDFSELGHFIEVPLKNYSSGMKARLGFSIATAVEPDVLILDEVLSVGDAKFREKSLKKVQSMFDSGVTVLFVSHNISQVKQICDKAILLNHGEIIANGDADEVCDLYTKMTKVNRTDQTLVEKEVTEFKVEQVKKQLVLEAKQACSLPTEPAKPVKSAAPAKTASAKTVPAASAKPVPSAKPKAPVQADVQEKTAPAAPVKPSVKPQAPAVEKKAEEKPVASVKAGEPSVSTPKPTEQKAAVSHVHIDIPKRESSFDVSNYSAGFVDIFSSSQSTAAPVSEEKEKPEASKPSRASIQFANMQNRTIQPDSKTGQRKLGGNRSAYTNSAATHSGIDKTELEEIIKSFSK